MLIVTRRIGEKIQIGDDITVVIVDAWGQQARMGIDALRDVPIHRKEVHDLLKQRKDSGLVHPGRVAVVVVKEII
jgi:carbon storage regulator